MVFSFGLISIIALLLHHPQCTVNKKCFRTRQILIAEVRTQVDMKDRFPNYESKKLATFETDFIHRALTAPGNVCFPIKMAITGLGTVFRPELTIFLLTLVHVQVQLTLPKRCWVFLFYKQTYICARCLMYFPQKYNLKYFPRKL